MNPFARGILMGGQRAWSWFNQNNVSVSIASHIVTLNGTTVGASTATPNFTGRITPLDGSQNFAFVSKVTKTANTNFWMNGIHCLRIAPGNVWSRAGMTITNGTLRSEAAKPGTGVDFGAYSYTEYTAATTIWCKVERSGSNILTATSTDGTTWTARASYDVTTFLGGNPTHIALGIGRSSSFAYGSTGTYENTALGGVNLF